VGLPTFGADSLLDSDTLTSSPAADAGFPLANLKDDRVFTIYKPSAAGTLDIQTDAGVGQTSNVDYFGMIGHDLNLRGATLTFQHSPLGSVWTTVFTVTPSDDLVIFRSFTQVSKRFFRARITGAAAAVAIGQLQWGTKVEMPYGMASGFDPLAERSELGFNGSQTGNIVGSVHRFTERRAALRFPLVESTFVDGTTLGQFREFWDNHAGIGKPFFVSWNAGNPGSFEKDTIFGVADAEAGIRRPLATQLAAGMKDVEFEVMALKE